MADSEKTEKATPKRRSDERKKGNIFQSHEVVTVASLIVAFYALKFLGPTVVTALKRSMTAYFEMGAQIEEITPSHITSFFIDGCMTFVIAAVPMLLVANVVSIVFTVAQTKLLVSFQAIKPKFNRLNPLQGIKKMFSMRGLVELAKSLIKITVLGAVLYSAMRKDIPTLPRMMDMSVEQVMSATGGIVLDIVKSAAIIFAFLAIFDYIYQWWEYEKNLRMSKQEIKEEFKQTEGDPQIKGRIREKQRQMAQRRMMQNVPTADVVIRNPTHVAVAVRYRPGEDYAPVVVAKGVDAIALKIVEIAEKNGIVVTENVPLARGLYAAVEVDEEIPGQFYQAVAEVLAFVYSLKKKDLR